MSESVDHAGVGGLHSSASVVSSGVNDDSGLTVDNEREVLNTSSSSGCFSPQSTDLNGSAASEEHLDELVSFEHSASYGHHLT
jgi:hypothetical protein